MKLSVIIPAYNEQDRITETLRGVDSYLSKQAYGYEIIVVVNGSRDRTYDIVKGLEQGEISHAVAMNLPQGGKGNAVKRGVLDKADGDVIMFMDADNATPISEVSKFLAVMSPAMAAPQAFDVVIGSRYLDPSMVKHRQPLFRVILSRMANLAIQILAVPGIKDTQLGFKAFSKTAAKDIFNFVTISRWGFDMEVLTIARSHKYKIKELPVLWTEHGGTHVPLKAYVESLVDLLKIKLKLLKGDYSKK